MAENAGEGRSNQDDAKPNPRFNAKEILHNLAGFMAQQMNHNPNRNDGWTKRCSSNQLNQLHPAGFKDKTDPVSAENWILDIGELCRMLGCIDEQKVLYASYKQSGEAKRWWILRSALLE